MPASTPLNPPKIAIRIANVVFVLGAVLSVLISAYAAYRIFFPIFALYTMDPSFAYVRTFYVISISAGIISAILFGFGLRLKDHIKVNLSLLFITTGVTVYAVETYLEFSEQLPDQAVIEIENIELRTVTTAVVGATASLFSDKRTKLEVLTDLRTDGIEAYPNVHPNVLLESNVHPNVLLESISSKDGLPAKNGKIFPLGAISNRLVVQANETGTWMMYVADKYGFHNPANVYDSNAIDIVMTGDSYSEGWAVQSDENISAVLHTFGVDVLNLGKSGNGALLQYAALKEYANSFKPRIVLWMYFENDIENDLVNELESALLRQYLTEDNFSQNLISRQQEIDDALIQYIKDRLLPQHRAREREHRERVEAQLKIGDRKKLASKSLLKILKLRNLRKIINLTPEDQFIYEEDTYTTDLNPHLQFTFRQTLEKANQLVSSWNGRLYFVYLPSGKTLIGDQHPPWRQFSLNTATELRIPIIDIEKEVFSDHDDIASLYPFRNIANHHNAKGYRLIAEAIAERLKADGVLP